MENYEPSSHGLPGRQNNRYCPYELSKCIMVYIIVIILIISIQIKYHMGTNVISAKMLVFTFQRIFIGWSIGIIVRSRFVLF